MNILYEIGNSLYVNITNRCSCACIFCIRKEAEGVHGSESLWLEHEPSINEIIQAFEQYNLDQYDSIVFCGYGEPLERLDTILEICKYIRSKSNTKIRINTNGLSDLINGKETAELLKGFVDVISISLNAPNKHDYVQIVRPAFGEKSFESMLKFAKDCSLLIGNVSLTVVDEVLSQSQIDACREIAEEINATFRIRKKV
jgi:radical SAM enzyme (TIGR04100 family)